MGKRLLFWMVLLTAMLLVHPVFAQREEALKQNWGVRPMGMGSAFVAVADDVNAIFYNPAGLGGLGFQYGMGSIDSSGDSLKLGTYVNLTLGSLGYANWQRENLQSQRFDVSALGFGMKGTNGVSWGLTYKDVIDVGNGSTHAWSSDVGLLFRVLPTLRVGILGRDFFRHQAMTDVRGSYRVGVAWKPRLNSLVFAADADYLGSDPAKMHYGVETALSTGLLVRYGFDESRSTAGATFQLPLFTLQYAASFDNTGGGNTIHRFGFEIGRPVEQLRPFAFFQPREVAIINLVGPVQGGRSRTGLLFGGRIGVDDLLATFKLIEEDPRIEGVLIRFGGIGEGGLLQMGVIQELRHAIRLIQARGKKVVMYVEGEALEHDYYFVAVADKIIASPGAWIGAIGKSVSVTKYKALLESIGVTTKTMTKGNQKGALSPLTGPMNVHQLDWLRGVVADLFRTMVQDLSQDRKLSLATLKGFADGRLFSAQEAKEKGLIDELGYYHEAKALVGKLIGAGETPKLVEPHLLVSGEENTLFSLPHFWKIAVLDVDGEMVTGKSQQNVLFGSRVAGADTFEQKLEEATSDVQVQVILIRINSPGGSALAADQMYQALLRARKKKKIVVSFGDIATSGGYYLACAADRIYANPSTITGSIGVIGQLQMHKALFDKLHIDTTTVKEGKHADMFSGMRSLTKEEERMLDRLQQEAYDRFVQAVQSARQLSLEEVVVLAQGQVFTGQQALDRRLVDGLGGFRYAVDACKSLSHWIGEPQIVYYRDEGDPLITKLGKTLQRVMGLENGQGVFSQDQSTPRERLLEYR